MRGLGLCNLRGNLSIWGDRSSALFGQVRQLPVNLDVKTCNYVLTTEPDAEVIVELGLLRLRLTEPIGFPAFPMASFLARQSSASDEEARKIELAPSYENRAENKCVGFLSLSSLM